MSEAELFDVFMAARDHLDGAIAQLIALNSALVVGTYYFLHRSRLWVKTAVFVMYLIGWLVFVMSASFSGRLITGTGADLSQLIEAGTASATTLQMAATLSDGRNIVYMVALNGATFLLLISAFVFLFFWTPRDKAGAGDDAGA